MCDENDNLSAAAHRIAELEEMVETLQSEKSVMVVTIAALREELAKHDEKKSVKKRRSTYQWNEACVSSISLRAKALRDKSLLL